MNVLIEIVVQSLSCVQLFVTLWTAACQAFLSFTSPLRESFPRQVDKESRGPQGERDLKFSASPNGSLLIFTIMVISNSHHMTCSQIRKKVRVG